MSSHLLDQWVTVEDYGSVSAQGLGQKVNIMTKQSGTVAFYLKAHYSYKGSATEKKMLPSRSQND